MKKKLLILLLTVVAALCCALCFAGCGGEDSMNVTTESGFTLNFAENSYILKEYSGNDTNVVIPEEYNDIPIISIGYEAFRGCTNLTSITIPDSVTSIGSGAFWNCTSLTNVNIPEGVTSIGDSTFSGCTSLTSITIPDSVTSIGNYAFEDCTSLTEVHITDIVAWCNIAFGRNYANPLYYADSLYLNNELVTEITANMLQGVTSIPVRAFSCTSLTSITIPDSVTSIGSDAFWNCTSLTEVHITDIVAWCNIAFGRNYANPLYYAHKLYLNNNLVTEITVDMLKGATEIKYSAFYGCTNLTSVTIPDSVTSIGDYAFMWCESLTSVTIPDSVTSIGSGAFWNCTSLTNITIPDSVTSIGGDAFEDCTSLTSVTIGNGVTSIGNRAFAGCTNLTSITILDSVTSIGVYAFEDCTSLESITIPDSVTYIGGGAFYNCTSLTSVKFENTDGWKVSKNYDMSDAQDVTVTEDTLQNAELLKSTYCDYYWKRYAA